MKRRTNCINTIVCVAFSLSISISSLARAERGRAEGELWLKWSPQIRQAFVMAYVEAYYDGYANGCQEGTRLVPGTAQPYDESPFNKCIDRKLDLTKGTDLVKDVTEFYREYPENRNLFVREILQEIGKGRSLWDIHNRPPYPPVAASTQQTPGIRRNGN